MKRKYVAWATVIVALIGLVMIGSRAWASPAPTPADIVPQATPGLDADKVDGHHAVSSGVKLGATRANKLVWTRSNGRLHWRAMPQKQMDNHYVNDDQQETIQASVDLSSGHGAVLKVENTDVANGGYAIVGMNASDNVWRPAIYGENTGNSAGVYGYSEGWHGTVGWQAGTDAGHAGVYGENGGSGGGPGVYGYSANGIGVWGRTSTTDSYGVIGTQPDYSTADVAGYWESGGLFGGLNGVIGITKQSNGYGVLAWNQATSGSGSIGLYAQTDSPDAYAGYFSSVGNGVHITTPGGKTGLTVSGGSKNAAVPTSDGTRLLYTEESTEVWFTDYGFGQLQDGQATIFIDSTFAETVNLEEPYHVFVQVYGDADVYVSNRTPTQFEVHLSGEGNDVEFSYRIVAKRLGFEGQRVERIEEEGVAGLEAQQQ